MAFDNLSTTDKQQILSVAKESLDHAVNNGQLSALSVDDYPGHLLKPGAAFVTLTKHGHLRGCIGSLEAWRPLIEDVAENALAAALRDPRFSSVVPAELADIDVHVSVLTPPEDIQVASEADLLDQLVPFEDGLILSFGNHRATYLPSVWEQLPDKSVFVSQLKLKAGLSADFWSDRMHCQRYRCISIADSA